MATCSSKKSRLARVIIQTSKIISITQLPLSGLNFHSFLWQGDANNTVLCSLFMNELALGVVNNGRHSPTFAMVTKMVWSPDTSNYL